MILTDWPSAMIEAESATPGLKLTFIQRLHTLKRMGRALVANGDGGQLVLTIAAIIRAYRSKQLDWHHSLVTYWSHGTQIRRPRPFHYEEFLEVNEKHGGHTGFWVEGMFPLEYASHMATQPPESQELRPGPDTYCRHMYLSVRMPHHPQTSMQFLFMDDTGADFTVMYQEDIAHLGVYRDLPPLLGAVETMGSSGEFTTRLCRALEN